MAHSQEKPFRFLNLPKELRDEIYSLLLCSIEPRAFEPSYLPVPHPALAPLGLSEAIALNSICQAKHNVDTTILRTSRQVHREAYDVMVKTNQFMHIRATGIPINLLLVSYQIPVVTMDRQHANQFKGYMLELHTYIPDESENVDEDDGRPRFDLMILGRDWSLFCTMLSQANAHISNYSSSMTLMDLSLKPRGGWTNLPDYKTDVSDFFEAKVQQNILKPFRALRGIPNVSVDGHLPSELMDIIDDEVARPRYTDPTNVVQIFKRYKEKGDEHLKAGDLKAAGYQYGEAVSEWRTMRTGNSWPSLLKKGGSLFLDTSGELYARLLLNAAQTSLKWMQTPELLAKEPLQRTLGDGTVRILKELLFLPHDVKGNGGTWRLTSQQHAKGNYRMALCMRLMRNVHDLEAALHYILVATEEAPNDALVAQERQTIEDWVIEQRPSTFR